MYILTWWENFKLNLAHWYQYATVWVLSVWGIGELYWQTMVSDTDKQAIFDAVPFGLGKLVPVVLFAISYFAAHGWPQPALAAKIEVSTEKAVANSTKLS